MDLGRVLFDILVVLVAAKLAAELAERVGIPAVVGEIVAGVAVGPSVLHLVGHGDEVLRTLGEIGVILLLLEVGLQMDLRELAAVGRASLGTATVGVVSPLVLGLGAMELVGDDAKTSLFVAAALTATSVGITARVFGDLRALATTEARVVLGAAVADDVMGLVVLTVVVRLATGGSVSVLGVAGIVAVALAFLVLGGLVAVRLAPPLFARVEAVSRSTGTMVALALAFTLVFAELADAAKLAPIVGAFVAGLALARTRQADRIRHELAPVGHLFIPVFFLQIGIDADVASFFHPTVLRDAAVLLAVAVVGKLVAAWGAVGTPADKLMVGLGMLPRGEVGLIFATLGLQAGVLDQGLYASLLLVVLATTLLTPPLLKLRSGRLSGAREGAASASATVPAGPTAAARPVAAAAATEPTGGSPLTSAAAGAPAAAYLRVVGNEVALTATPPARLAVPVALRAAVLVADARPSPGLLDWLAAAPGARGAWSALQPADVPLMFDVLRRGNTRSWRFLETVGVLDGLLPDVADALRARQADPFEPDPAAAHRWGVLGRLRDDPAIGDPAGLGHPEWLLLAGLLDEAFEGWPDRDARARSVMRRLDLGASAEEYVTGLLRDRGLLWAAVRRPDGLGEERVLDLADRLGGVDRARAQFLLASAESPDVETWQRQRLAELRDLVGYAVRRPDLTGLDARNRVARARAEALRLLGEDADAAARLRDVPRWYLLTAPAADVARQARLVTAAAGHDAVEVAVSADGSAPAVDVAAAWGGGVLSAVVGALGQLVGGVRRLVLVTWPDGAVAVSCRLPAGARIDSEALRGDVAARARHPPTRRPVAPVLVELDDDASPWWTVCTARWAAATDGLAAVAAGLAATGALVNAAVVERAGDVVVARLEITDEHGHKLTAGARDTVRAAVLRPAMGRARWWRPRRFVFAAGRPRRPFGVVGCRDVAS